MANLPPDAPIENLVEVSLDSLHQGDEIYFWDKYGVPKWRQGTFLGIEDSQFGIEFVNILWKGKSKYYPTESVTKELRLFKKKDLVKESLSNKFARQQVAALGNTKIGFNGPPMNLIGKYMGLKKIPGMKPGVGGRRKTRRRRQRRSRKN